MFNLAIKIPTILRGNFFITCIIATLFSFIYNAQFWGHIIKIYEQKQEDTLLFFVLSPIAITALMCVIFMALFSYKYVLKISCILLFLTTSIITYASFNYGVIFDSDMMQNIFETNVSEAKSYFSIKALLYFLILGLIPSFILYKIKINYCSSFFKAALIRSFLIIVFLAIALAIVLPNYQKYSFIGRNNHTLLKEIVLASYIVGTTKYLKSKYFKAPNEYIKVGEDAISASNTKKPFVLVFVVGETARSMNFSAYGYGKETNKYTKLENVISFKNISSCATATAQSLPCMFSNLNRSEFSVDKTKYRDNLIDVLTRAGIDAIWLENDGGCKGVCDKIKTINIDPKKNPKYCTSDYCYDGIMVDYAKDIISKVEKDTVVFFHLIGSHGPNYYNRYPDTFRQFLPECKRSDVENCSLNEVVNSYDNTILYTDYVIYTLIDKVLEKNFDKINPMLYYISDHGESLGENGLFLHGAPYLIAPSEQTKIPMQLWLPNTTADKLNLDKKCLTTDAAEQELSHDNVFHTTLRSNFLIYMI